MTSEQLKKMKEELRAKTEEAYAALDKAIAKAADAGAEKTVTERRLTAARENEARQLVSEVALKGGAGRAGTLQGVMAARMLGKRGGPPHGDE